MIEMHHKNSKFEDHHHHHHHHHILPYRRPVDLTTDIGLFALKKMAAMNPDILTEREKRLLQPAAPGLLTNLTHSALLAATTGYVYTLWRNFGPKFVLNVRAMVPVVGLAAASFGFQVVANRVREVQWTFQRSKLVRKYKDQFGQEYLLDVLNPTFRFPESPSP